MFDLMLGLILLAIIGIPAVLVYGAYRLIAKVFGFKRVTA